MRNLAALVWRFVLRRLSALTTGLEKGMGIADDMAAATPCQLLICLRRPRSGILLTRVFVFASLMALDSPETTSKIGGPLVKQFSIFLPNKVGAMLDIVKLLSTRNAHVVALSIAEQTDSAIARIVVSDPEAVENIFHEHDVAFGVCEMVVVEMQEVATELAKLLAALLMAEVNMHFSYPLLTRPHGRAALALHVDDTECACSVLQGEGFKMLSQADISR